MDFFFYIFVIFIIVKVAQYIIKSSKEQSQGMPAKAFPQSEMEMGYDPMDDTIKSSLNFYVFEIDRKRQEFSFTVAHDMYRFNYTDLKEYAIRTQNEAVIIIDLKINKVSLPSLQIECFSKLEAIGRLPEDKRRPVPLHQLYEMELRKAGRIGQILTEIMEEKPFVKAETPPPFILEEKIEKKVENKREEIKTTIEEKPNLFDIIESIHKDKGEKEIIPEIAPEPVVPEEKYMIEKEIIEKPLTEITTESTENNESSNNDSIKISLSDIEEYSYGKFLDSDIREAVGNAKMKGQKEVLITKEQLEKLRQ